jgi:hypothetical protein
MACIYANCTGCTDLPLLVFGVGGAVGDVSINKVDIYIYIIVAVVVVVLCILPYNIMDSKNEHVFYSFYQTYYIIY